MTQSALTALVSMKLAGRAKKVALCISAALAETSRGALSPWNGGTVATATVTPESAPTATQREPSNDRGARLTAGCISVEEQIAIRPTRRSAPVA